MINYPVFLFLLIKIMQLFILKKKFLNWKNLLIKYCKFNKIEKKNNQIFDKIQTKLNLFNFIIKQSTYFININLLI
jgi:hypothetical protein